MTQLLLGLAPHPPPSFDNFVSGRNAAVLATLRAFGASTLSDRCIFLWGEPGSGCTHLLRAWSTTPARHAVDAVESLDDGAQIELFNLYNRVRAGEGHLLVCGRKPPRQLALRADLQSRLAWGLSFEIHALSDDEKRAALAAEARARHALDRRHADEHFKCLPERVNRIWRLRTDEVQLAGLAFFGR